EDFHTAEITCWFQEVYDLYVSSNLVHEALVTMAHKDTYHPVKDYLAGLTWDGTPRLDTWLTTYCHVEHSPYVRAVGPKTLIAGVARVMEPGCKVDTITVLVGKQGYMKSSVWHILAGDPWFTDHLSDLHSKDAAGDLLGKWIVEFGDLDTLRRSENE